MARRLRGFAVLAGLFVSGVHCAAARAQAPPSSAQSSTDPPSDSPSDPPPPSTAPPQTAPPAAPPPAPVEAATPAELPARPIPATRPRTYAFPVATLPGFEMLPDGGSRLFVEITRKVNVEEKRAARVLTFVLKGTRVVYRNNENALVTVHFNTPVSRARLLPSGRDLLFSVDLRADATPAWKMVTDEDDGSATLQVDFPKGSFLPTGALPDPPSDNPPPPVPSAPPPKQAWRGHSSPDSAGRMGRRQPIVVASPAVGPGGGSPPSN
jgi:hypothetical protein